MSRLEYVGGASGASLENWSGAPESTQAVVEGQTPLRKLPVVSTCVLHLSSIFPGGTLKLTQVSKWVNYN